MSQLFGGCSSITDISALKSQNTANVENMFSMFEACSSIINASALNDQNIAKVSHFDGMFYGCQTHPEFTKRAGTWNDKGTFIPST